MNLSELSNIAAQQSEARAENFKSYLKTVREETGRLNTEIQSIITKSGEKREKELKADMEAQLVSEEKRAGAKIMADHAEKHGSAEWNDNNDAPFRKLARSLFGASK